MSIAKLSNNIQLNSQPKVAVVIPVYNAAPYLTECLDSVFSQKYSNFFVIAVDDGSTDGSSLILDEYAKKEQRLHVLHTANHGYSAARNTALELIDNDCSINFVAFTDSDDKVKPEMLTSLVSDALLYNSDIVGCAFYKFEGNQTPFAEGKIFHHHHLTQEDFVSLILAEGRYKKLCGRGGMVWKCLYRSSVIHGLRFDEDRNTCEDELFNITAALHAKTITYLPEVLYLYRIRYHPKNLSAQWDLKLAEGRYRAFCLSKKYSEKTALIIVTAYIKSILSFAKKTNDHQKLTIKIPQAWLSKVLNSKSLNKKNKLLWFLLTKHPKLFQLYRRLN